MHGRRGWVSRGEQGQGAGGDGGEMGTRAGFLWEMVRVMALRLSLSVAGKQFQTKLFSKKETIKIQPIKQTLRCWNSGRIHSLALSLRQIT